MSPPIIAERAHTVDNPRVAEILLDNISEKVRCVVPLAITVFGVAKRQAEATLCYAFIRFVRGAGNYPAPTLPKNGVADGDRRIPIEGYELELLAWDKIFEDTAAYAVQAELDNGRFTVPRECPVEPGSSINGQPFGPVIIMERQDRIRVSGTGLLYMNGIAVNDGIERVKRNLDRSVDPAIAPAVLGQMIELIAEQSGLGPVFIERRRIGGVDQFYRAQTGADRDGALFVVIAEMLDFRRREPMRRVCIRRYAAAADQPFRLHVTLKNFDEILNDVLLDMPAGQPEVIVEANSHITDVAVAMFDSNGRLVDQLSGCFAQGINFGLTVQGRVDKLPPAFAGVPRSTDLESRSRIHTIAFERPSLGDGTGGLDVLRKERKRIAMAIGEPGDLRENVAFRPSRGKVERNLSSSISSRRSATSRCWSVPASKRDEMKTTTSSRCPTVWNSFSASTFVSTPGGQLRINASTLSPMLFSYSELRITTFQRSLRKRLARFNPFRSCIARRYGVLVL